MGLKNTAHRLKVNTRSYCGAIYLALGEKMTIENTFSQPEPLNVSIAILFFTANDLPWSPLLGIQSY
ncbi:hypothetical protein GCM10009084_04540 [Marinomonas primoryensis]